jgi:hypothetical protein
MQCSDTSDRQVTQSPMSDFHAFNPCIAIRTTPCTEQCTTLCTTPCILPCITVQGHCESRGVVQERYHCVLVTYHWQQCVRHACIVLPGSRARGVNIGLGLSIGSNSISMLHIINDHYIVLSNMARLHGLKRSFLVRATAMSNDQI